MNTSEFISLLTQAITAFTALIALFLIIKQINQFNMSLRSQVYQELINNSLEIDKLLIEKPELRKYIYGDAIVSADIPEVDQIMSLMEMIVDVLDNLGAQYKFIPKSEKEGWQLYAKQILSSPAAEYFITENGSWFSGNIPKLLGESNWPNRDRKQNDLLPTKLSSYCYKPFIQSLMSPKVSIQKSQIHGLGIFAIELIKQGEILLIKGGHIVIKSELISSDKINSYLPIDDNYYIGAVSKGEETKIKLYINHSCNPNCGLRGEITFISMREIQVGEEITCDYAMIDNEAYEFECYCKSDCCRKTITGFDWKIPELQKKYGNYFARYLLDKINKL